VVANPVAASSPAANAASQPSNSIDVTAAPFNADNTGQADDQTALQSAFATAKTSGKSVWLPAGTYNHSGVLNADGITIVGAGANVSNPTVVVATAYASEAIHLTGASPSISRLMTKVAAPGATSRLNAPQSASIWVEGATNASVSYLIIQGASSNGVRLDGAQNSLVAHNLVLGTNADGIGATHGAVNNVVQNNMVYESGDDAYSDDSYLSEAPLQDAGNQFVDNIAYQIPYGRGFAATGSINGTFSGNLIARTTWYSTYVTTDPSSNTQATSGWTVKDNTLEDWCWTWKPKSSTNSLVPENWQVTGGCTGLNANFTGTSDTVLTNNSSVSSTTDTPDFSQFLGWDPSQYLVDRLTFNPTYVVGTGQGANN